MQRKLLFFILLLNISIASAQSVWQWSVPMRDGQGNIISDYANAFLWVPEKCKKLNAIILVQHNMIEEGILEHPAFRKQLQKLGIGEIWTTNNFSINYDKPQEANAALQYMLDELAMKSGYEELKSIPIIPMGHSAMATYPWNFALANPERTLAVISLKGDAPTTNLTGSGRPNVDWENRNIAGIPGLMVMGEYEFWEDRRTPGFKYLERNPNTTPITFYADAGRGHFDVSPSLISFLAEYITLAYKNRVDKSSHQLKPIKLKGGYLMDIWRKDSLPQFTAKKFEDYDGPHAKASWVFNKKMAKDIEAFYASSRFKKVRDLGFMQGGKPVEKQKTHANYHLKFVPELDGKTFHVKAVDLSGENAKVSLNRICGPFTKVNDTTFKIQFDKIGMDNPKRSNDLWFLANVPADKEYKNAVQQANMRIPFKNEEGRKQNIEFYAIKDQKEGTKKVRLNAISDAALKVDFYVKAGPAIIDQGELRLTKIPPSAKFPVKVTVVAWQYGTSTGNKVQSAMPVERSFYITK